MIRVLTTLAAVVALAVSATPASAVSNGTNTRLAAFSPPTSPPTPPGVPIPYPNFPDPGQVPTRPIK
jgi:hypothetical protein